jgi:hypothetical protein
MTQATADATAQGSTNAAAATTKTDETKSQAGSTVVGDAATGTTKAGSAESGKTGEAGAQGTTAQAGTADAKPKTPEKYELKLPEGGHLEQSDLDYLAGIAKQAGWSNEEAQAAVDEQNAAIHAQSDRWLAETRADKDYGGDKLELSQRLARAVISKVRPPGHPRRDAFIRFIDRGGAGNQIEVVAFLADLGKLMAEDGPISGKTVGGDGNERTAEEILYPKKT